MNTNIFVRFFISKVVPVIFISLLIPVLAFSAERLVVKDSQGSSTFVVEDDGLVFTSTFYLAQSEVPGFWLDETVSGNKGAFLVLHKGWVQIQRRSQNFGDYEASPFFIHIGAPNRSFYIDEIGYVGLGVSAAYPLHMASGAYVSTGGVWTNASSREYKKDIKELTQDEAVDALKELKPVRFSYKANPDEQHVGFIAEDAPELVATKDRKGMSSMDVVGVLTKVLQEQQKTVQEQRATIAELSRRLAQVEKRVKTN